MKARTVAKEGEVDDPGPPPGNRFFSRERTGALLLQYPIHNSPVNRGPGAPIEQKEAVVAYGVDDLRIPPRRTVYAPYGIFIKPDQTMWVRLGQTVYDVRADFVRR